MTCGARITMLGTGSAFVTRCYNTCFVLHDTCGAMLVDAGGGNGVLCQMEDAGIAMADIHDLFVTHCHTDHILGTVWVVRKVVQLAKAGDSAARLAVHAHGKALDTVQALCSLTLAPKDMAIASERVTLHRLEDGDAFAVGGMEVRCFDIRSTKERQFGFRATLASGRSVVCLGDEPFNEANRPVARDADWLMHEAFCLHADSGRFEPYEKHHSTALDAGRDAASLGAGGLIIYHTEDKTLATRKEAYAAEAATAFGGRIVVPDDLEVIPL